MNQENKGVKSKCCGAGARFIDEIKCCRNCGNEFIPQPSESKPERKCDGCKLFSTMGVHSFTCPIRQQPIHVTFSESLEENGEEIKMEDCQVCNQYICKCPVKEFTPPTDSNWEKELRDDIFIPDGHIGLTRRELSEIIDKANGKQKEDFISDICLWLTEKEEKVVNFIKQTLQQERQREREKMIEEVEKLKLKSGKANRRGQHFINEDDYNDALDKVLDIIKNKE